MFFNFLAHHLISQLHILSVDSKYRRPLINSQWNSNSRHYGDFGSLVQPYRNYKLICVFGENSNMCNASGEINHLGVPMSQEHLKK